MFGKTSSHLKAEEVCFSSDELIKGQKEWELSLIGYVIGKRLLYGTLLAVVK